MSPRAVLHGERNRCLGNRADLIRCSAEPPQLFNALLGRQATYRERIGACVLHDYTDPCAQLDD